MISAAGMVFTAFWKFERVAAPMRTAAKNSSYFPNTSFYNLRAVSVACNLPADDPLWRPRSAGPGSRSPSQASAGK